MNYFKKLYTSFDKLGGNFVDAFSSSRAKKIAAVGMGAYLACTGATIATVGYYSSKIAIGVFAMSFLEMPILSSIGLAVFGTMGVVSGLAALATVGGIVGIAKKALPEFNKTSVTPENNFMPENVAPTVLGEKVGDDFNAANRAPAANPASNVPVDYFLKNAGKRP